MKKTDHIRKLIQGEIKKAHGQEILYAKDCQVLSMYILQKTKRSVSVTTLKRLFGIIDSPYFPSQYTLDTISIYLNYRDWSDFEEKSTGQQDAAEMDHWSALKSRIEVITNRSLESIRSKLSDQLLDFKPREFAIEKFDRFLNSSYTATAFIAPGGFGKTTMTTQLTELFFTGTNARYPDDIVCLIDGSILINLMNLNLEIVRIKNILDFEEEKSFANYFFQHPGQVKGRFVLIIESLYQIYHQEEKLQDFVANLMDILNFYKDTPWFKCLITCRPDNWKLITYHIQTRPDFKRCWSDVIFEGSSADYTNVPLLGTDEIDHFLRRRFSRKRFEKLKFLYADMKDLLSRPYLLNLFSFIESTESMHSDLEILENYYSTKIFVEPYLEEKNAIIDAFIQQSEYGKNTYAVKKTDLPMSGTQKLAYEHLVFNNLIYDYTVTGRYLSVGTYVRFTNDSLLGYVVANAWIKESSFNLELIERVYAFYEMTPVFRSQILKYLIKIAFREKNTAILYGMLHVLFTGQREMDPVHMDQGFLELVTTIGLELRKDQQTRDRLVPKYANSEAGRFFYFERFFDMDSLVLHSGRYLDLYLDQKLSREAAIYGYFTRFMQYFLLDDQVKCMKTFKTIRALVPEKYASMTVAAYYFSAHIIFQSDGSREIRSLPLQTIFNAVELYSKDPGPYRTASTVFWLNLFAALNYASNYAEIIKLFKRAQQYNNDILSLQSWEFQLCRLIYARALLKEGKAEKARRIFDREELLSVPYNCKNYVALQHMFIQLEFLVHAHKFDEARQIINKIKTISQVLKFKYFYKKAVNFERTILSVR